MPRGFGVRGTAATHRRRVVADVAARMRYKSTLKKPKVTDPLNPVAGAPDHGGLLPVQPPKPEGRHWSIESYPYADPNLATPEDSP